MPGELLRCAGGQIALAREVLVRLVSLFLAASLLVGPAWAQITLAPSSLPDATLGAPYSQSFFILGGTAPYHVSLVGRLPAGMTFANEMIAGTPTESGIFSFSVFASDSVGASDTRGYTLSVRPPTISVFPSGLPDGTVGSGYSQSLSAFGGTAPYSFSASGTLPPGITMDPTGLLSGTPSSPGSYTFSAIVTDSTTGDGPYVAASPYTLVIAPGNLSFPPTVPGAIFGQPYAHALSATGGTAPYTFALLVGGLPDGLSLAPDGLISGTPRGDGTFDFAIFAQDSTSGTPINGSQYYSLTVALPTITLTPASLPRGQVGTDYSAIIAASGGTGPYSYSAVGLPPGLTLDAASGAISGTPSSAGSFNVVATASDADLFTGSSAFVLHIDEALAISPPAGAVTSATVGSPYSLTISGSGGATPYSYGISSGTLPAGLGLDPTTGAIAGTPTTPGVYHFEVTLTDANNGAVTAAYVLTVRQIGAALPVDPPSGVLPGGQVGIVYSQSFSASGGSGNYTYALSGDLPTGLSLNPATGVLSGLPTVASTFIFTITATDTLDPANTGSAVFTLAIAAGGLSLSPTVPGATFGQPYAHTLSASGGSAPYTFTLLYGALPAGLSLGPDGLISGTPREEGMLHFVVFAQDSTSGTPINGSRTYSMSVAPSTITLTPASLPRAQVGNAYSTVITASGGTAPYTYSTTGLPPGMTLDAASGTVSGTPVSAGSFSVFVTATDANLSTGSTTVVLQIDAALAISPPAGAIPAATAGTPYSLSISGSGGTPPYRFTLSSGALPNGLTLDTAIGVIAGTPTAPGLHSFDVTLTDANSAVVAAAYTLDVRAAPASANADLAGLLPGAGSLQPGFNAGTLSYSVSVGSAVETITLTPIAADANASITVGGQPVASGTASGPIALLPGPNPVNIAVTAQDGTTTRTYTVTVTRAAAVFIRPDPSQDPEVVGLLSAHGSTARRFAQRQITNFQGRLEQLHDEGERGASSMDVHFAVTQTPSTTAAQQIDQMIASSHGAALNARPIRPGAAATMPGVLAYGPDEGLSAAYGPAGLGALPDSTFTGPDLGRLAIWSGGYVNFGARDNGVLDLDHTLVGVSGGLDYRFSEQFIGGFGVGYGRDRTDIGQNGTASGADAYSAALYGSYKPIDNLFIDALIGGSWMSFDSTRYVTANGDFATGSRDGTQLFGALTAAYEFRDEAWLISPYGRVEFSRSWLDGYSETVGGIYGLTYGDQTIDALSAVLGIRANYAFQMDWGTLRPGVRAEYTHDFERSSRARLSYTDLGGLAYSIAPDPTVRDYLMLGLSLDFQFDNDWDLGLDYRTSIGGSNIQDHTLGAKLEVRF